MVGGFAITMKKVGNQIMGERIRISLILCCCLWISSVLAQSQPLSVENTQAAQPTNTLPSQPTAPASNSYQATIAPARDPFAMTPELANAGAAPQTHLRFTPAPALDVKLPRMSLKGMIRGQEGDVAALLDIAGNGVHMVRVNDTISLHGIGRDVVVQVKAIDHLSLVIEVGSLGQVIIVR